MFHEPLIGLSLDGHLVFYAVVAVVIAVMYWFLKRRDRQLRERFLARFDVTQLRMSSYKVGIVYRVIATTQAGVTVVPIWDDKAAIVDGVEINLPPDALISFDKSRFF